VRFLTGEKRKVSGGDVEHLRGVLSPRGGPMPDGVGVDRTPKPAWVRQADRDVQADQERLNRLVDEHKRSRRGIA